MPAEFYCYNVEAIIVASWYVDVNNMIDGSLAARLFFFFFFPSIVLPLNFDRCIQLAHSVYRLKASKSTSRYGGYVAKTTAVLLPVVQVSLMRTRVLQRNQIGFYFVANVTMGTSLALGILLLLAILGRYVATRAEMTWHVQYGSRSAAADGGNMSSNDLTSFTDTDTLPLYRKSIYDNWLLVRFTMAFAGLA